jgi:hypothetical protein
LAGGVTSVGDGATGRMGDAGGASVEIVSVGGGFGDAVGVAALGDDVAARVIVTSPSFCTSSNERVCITVAPISAEDGRSLLNFVEVGGFLSYKKIYT